MKLGKLLASGKSIMNGHKEVSYRSSKQIYLPKFGSAKNPFKPGAPAADAETTPPPAAAAEPRASASGPTRLGPSSESISPSFGPQLQRDRSTGTATSAAQPVKQSADYPSNRQSAIRDGCGANRPQSAAAAPSSHAVPRIDALVFKRVNALFSIFSAVLPARKARRSENTAKGQKGTPMQTELSLDTVKVVHNDLSDVDVEVVPIKSRAGAPDLPAPRNSWEFVGERLFGVEAT